jgi:transposase
MHDAQDPMPEMSDQLWNRLEVLLPGRQGTWGGQARDNRQFINAVLWILRTGAPWRELPARYGDWKNTHRRFCRWRDRGAWEVLLEALIVEADYEWLLINPPGDKASQQQHPWPWLRLVCRSEALLRQLPKRMKQLRKD